MTLAELNAASADAFTGTLGSVFEHSPWVAEAVAEQRPFASLDALHAAMTAAVRAAPAARRLALIRAHPDLAGKAALAGRLTDASRAEQAGAGLDALTPAELERFTVLNERYRERFGFPFVIAVKGLDKYAILAACERRLEHSPDHEFDTAIEQIARIAWFRLSALLG